MNPAMPSSPQPALPAACTFDEHDWYLLARCWYPVMETARLGTAPASACLLDQPLVLYRSADGIVIAPDRCPHRGVPLSAGHAEGEGIRCAYHGLHFGNAGRCIEVPSSPGRAISSGFHLQTYPAVERHGLIWTCLWPQEGETPDIPTLPFADDPAFRTTVCPCFPMDCFAGRQLEGFIDVAHFPWVHTATFADARQRDVPAYQISPCHNGFTSDYASTMSNYPIESGATAPPGFIWHRRFHVQLPFSASLQIDFPGDDRLAILNCASPVSACRTHLFVPIARNFATDRPDEEIHAFNLRIFNEDKALTEMQRPRRLPLQPDEEAHFPADRNGQAYRRALRAQGYRRFFDG